MDKITMARLVLYMGEPAFLERTLAHSLQNGIYKVPHGKLGIIDIASDQLLETLDRMDLTAVLNSFVMFDGQDMRPFLRDRSTEHERPWRV